MNATINEDLEASRANMRPIFIFFRDWLVSHIKVDPAWTMLEIGVGPGGFTPFYAKMVSHYIGLDVDDYSKNYTDIGNVKIIIYNGIEMPLESASIDLSVSHSCFEHVSEVGVVLAEAYRVLRPGGHLYLTINPMYYSSWGSHGTLPDHMTRLPEWDHLNPASPNYMTDCPPQMVSSGHKGCYLNKLTASQLLSEIGRLPWSIVRFERAYETMLQPPAFAMDQGVPIVDVLCHDIRLLVRKDW